MEVTNGILPIKMNSGHDKRELDRALFLAQSLNRHWHSEFPFHLHIVSSRHEAKRIAAGFSKLNLDNGRLSCHIHIEEDFFEPGSPFFAIKGMYKQQLIKLFVPPQLDLGAFITFDSDIVCLKDFDEKRFVTGDRLVSTWERKRLHSWWE